MNQLVNIKTRYNKTNKLAYAVLFAAFILALFTLDWVLRYCHYGLDFTDESFYLNWISNPWIYSSSLTQFGYIYHPLYLLVQGDIGNLRECNILIIFSLTWVVFTLLFKKKFNGTLTQKNLFTAPMLALSTIFATTSLLYFCPFGWLSTPSYNSLTLQALLLASIGILLIEQSIYPSSLFGWLITGTSGWLAFMAKPTSAALLATVIFVYILIAKKTNFKLILLSLLTATALLIISALFIDGSILLFIDRYKSAFSDLQVLDSHSNLFRWDELILEPSEKDLLIIKASILSLTSYWITTTRKYLNILGLSICIITISIGFIFIFNFFQPSLKTHPYPIIQIITVPISAVIICLLVGLREKGYPPFLEWRLALFFISLPYVMAFGTSNDYWTQSQLAGVFWVLTGMVILIPLIENNIDWKILLPTAVGSQVITIIIVQLAMNTPYRQIHPLQQLHQIQSIKLEKTGLILPKDQTTFFQNAQHLIKEKGFKTNDPIIDLTGQSPGMLFMMQAKAIGQAWIIGGYPGSDKLALMSLKRADCQDIATAWLLIEPLSTGKISPDILKHLGIDLKNNYIIAAEFITPIGMGSWNNGIHRKQLLLKPSRSIQNATKACQKNRNI